MRRNLLILALLFFIITFSFASRIALTEIIDYDDEFNKAVVMRGREAVFGTDYLIKETTEVLHRENMRTHAELEKLMKEVEELKEAIEEVKDIVEGGG